MSMDLYNEMWSDLHHKHNIHLNGVGLDCWKDIKKYIDDKDVLIEMIEQITNTLNCKVDEVEHLKKENQDLESLTKRIDNLETYIHGPTRKPFDE